ncbi:hypothetical protein ARALYDRAFT_323049 [Arabidopsis lyrata subsp. lyrata]|uniref:Uncharacterized protein n=2 Tax=Arabidopsis lyrata subsp. lyrata TaxID=81972 RepID=D7LP73_ARALL|nr:hypothetical protein ARALYDRAFT_323049 [Arabidopsis lyrata subsp. lyrata]
MHDHNMFYNMIRVLESSMEREECNSSESGWTTYISSPLEEEEEEVIDEVYYEGHSIEKDRRKFANEYENNKDSDDSMASDASSGPGYQQYPQTNDRGKRREGLAVRNGKGESNNTSNDAYLHHIDDKNSGNHISRKKEKKKIENKSRSHKKK